MHRLDSLVDERDIHPAIEARMLDYFGMAADGMINAADDPLRPWRHPAAGARFAARGATRRRVPPWRR